MSWFKRMRGGILTKTSDKKEVPDGVWTQCSKCKKMETNKDLILQGWICSNCGSHYRVGPGEYFHILFDKHEYHSLFKNLESIDILKFKDLKSYSQRLKDAKKKGGDEDSMKVAVGYVDEQPLVVCAMNFKFIGGSMGSLAGEKIARSIDFCIEKRYPLLIISQSGGARMMESAFSLMQMAKTSAKLTQLAKAKLPYFSLMTHPTTGGVTASYAMLGDINMGEPGALIGFAGPRVIKETIGRDLPEGFQTSEFLLDRGFLDFIVKRSELKSRISSLMSHLKVSAS